MMSEESRSIEPLPSGRPLPDGMLPCFHCGYDLRGSAVTGSCPECGNIYHRDSLYLDVARQRLRQAGDDIQFVWFASVAVAFCSVGLGLTAAVLRALDPFAIAAPLYSLAMLVGFFYLIMLMAYGYCWFRLIWEIDVQRLVNWKQVRAVGLHRPLFRTAVALAVPIMVLVLF